MTHQSNKIFNTYMDGLEVGLLWKYYMMHVEMQTFL